MIKACFLDFYGTVVYEDDEIIERIIQEIIRTGNEESRSEVGSYWTQEFQKGFMNAHGENFETQRNVEYRALSETIEHFGSTADAEALSNEMFAYWRKPPIFPESKEFFEKCPVPIYIVSNIDRADIMAAIEYHGLQPAGVFTSEDARSYKPDKELFELALSSTGLRADEVIHIGDSFSSDVKGAGWVDIDAIWVNRRGLPVRGNTVAVRNLLEVLEKIS